MTGSGYWETLFSSIYIYISIEDPGDFERARKAAGCEPNQPPSAKPCSSSIKCYPTVREVSEAFRTALSDTDSSAEKGDDNQYEESSRQRKGTVKAKASPKPQQSRKG